MHYIPSLRLRCDEETEIIGIDDKEMGEFAYDYVGNEPELGPPRQMYADNVQGVVEGAREPAQRPYRESKARPGSDSSHYPLNHYPMQIIQH